MKLFQKTNVYIFPLAVVIMARFGFNSVILQSSMAVMPTENDLPVYRRDHVF